MNKLISLQIVLIFAFSVPAAVINVDPNGTGDYPTIQAAVNAAKDGDEIVLADGVYTGPGNRNIEIHRIITIRSQNGPNTCVVDCNESGKEYYYGFRVNRERVTFEGISIINAYSERGAAFAFDNPNGKSTIINCMLSGNSARMEGGAVYLGHNTDVEFYNCSFIDNSSPRGGAIYCRGSLTLINSDVTNNSAVSDDGGDYKGGGIYIEYYDYKQKVRIQNCLFSENSAGKEAIYKAPPGNGGAVYCQINSSYNSPPISIENCTFKNNRAMGANCSGAAFYIKGSGSTDPRGLFNLFFTNCSFLQNKAGDSGTAYTNSRGGAIFCEQSRILLYKCIFNKNDASDAACMYLRGLKAVIANCIITGHTQNRGMKRSCILFEDQQEQSMILRSTITGNILYAIWVYNTNNPLIIRNSIIYGNNYPYNVSHGQIRGQADISYSCIQDGQHIEPFITNEGNIDVDPCFVDHGYWDTNDTQRIEDDFWVEGDYRLKADSPCRDAGCYPQYLLDNTDLNGMPRIAGNAIDMGAYEYQHPSIKVKLCCMPRTINTHSRNKTIIALLTMPDGITPDDIDHDEPLLFSPGDVESKRQKVYQRPGHGNSCTYIMAVFDLSDCIESMSEGTNNVTVTGKLKTGQRYFGSDTLRLFSSKWLPWLY